MTETIEAFALGSAASVNVATPPTSTEPLLAVLPFDNLSDDREMQFFSDGVSEEIIQRLSRGAQMKVIGRTSSFQFRGTDKTARNVAKELHCSHILDGSIRRAGGRVRIAAHLVEAASQTTLWSDRYDGILEDIFAVQDEISERIAAALDRTFTSFSTKAIDPAVYDLYLHASPKSYAPEELRTNVGLLQVATQRAPNFAEAWGRLAYLRAWLRLYQPFADRAESARLVASEAERALALDPQNIDALLAQFFVIPPFGRFVEADAVMARIGRAPGLGAGGIYVGWHSRAIGQLRESAEATERAFLLDALTRCPRIWSRSREWRRGALRKPCRFSRTSWRACRHELPGCEPAARASLPRGLGGGGPIAGSCGATPPARVSGRPGVHPDQTLPTPENIGAIRDALAAHRTRTGCVDVSRLVYAAHLGLVEEAHRTAETSCLGPRGTEDDIMGPDGYRTGLLFHAGMPELRNDPRFVPLCARLGLVEFWLATGKWPDCVDDVPYDFKAECEKVRAVPIDEFRF